MRRLKEYLCYTIVICLSFLSFYWICNFLYANLFNKVDRRCSLTYKASYNNYEGIQWNLKQSFRFVCSLLNRWVPLRLLKIFSIFIFNYYFRFLFLLFIFFFFVFFSFFLQQQFKVKLLYYRYPDVKSFYSRLMMVMLALLLMDVVIVVVDVYWFWFWFQIINRHLNNYLLFYNIFFIFFVFNDFI